MIEKRDMYFEPTQAQRPLHIYLPDDYYMTQERYPVMYFFDGHNLYFDSDATYGKSWGLNEFLNHYDKKFIVVGIECGHVGNERLVEYSPYNLGHVFGTYVDGIGDQTIDWIVHVLKPMIDQQYRTYSHREATGIGGSSMGGLMSLYAVVKYNKYFSKAACLSSAIGFCMPQITKDIESTSLDLDTRVYLSWGTDEIRRKKPLKNNWNSRMSKNNVKINQLLLGKGIMTHLYMQNGGKHCEADWEKQNQLYMDYLWK